MSELKVHKIGDLCFDFKKGKDVGIDFYLKDEADKVISELKAREDVLVTDNRDLQEKVKVLENQLLENAEHFKRNEAQILENADKEVRHQKHKRCLAMARLCESNVIWVKGCSEWQRWKKWHNHWLELAEKFKEGVELKKDFCEKFKDIELEIDK